MLRIIQITDTHLIADKQRLLQGIDTDHSLRTVLDHAVQHVAPIDYILVTGDVAHHAERDAYRRFGSYLEKTSAVIECLPGNHDSSDIMRASLAPYGIGCTRIFDEQRWRIVMLDSIVSGEHRGELSKHELARLDKALMKSPEGHALICLHHPPVPVGNPSMDEMGLSNAEDFFASLTLTPAFVLCCGATLMASLPMCAAE